MKCLFDLNYLPNSKSVMVVPRLSIKKQVTNCLKRKFLSTFLRGGRARKESLSRKEAVESLILSEIQCRSYGCVIALIYSFNCHTEL